MCAQPTYQYHKPNKRLRFNLRLCFVMADEYINFKEADFCPDSDSSDLDSYSDSDS